MAETGRRLVAVAWQWPGTGLTRVADRLLGSLGSPWSVDLVGIGYDGPVTTSGAVTRHPSDPGGRDVFGAHAAAELCRRGPRPDAVLIHNDLWLLPRYADVIGPHLEGAPLLGYLPLDGEADPLPPEMLDGLRPYGALAVYTEWARQTLSRAFASARLGDVPALELVPHGVDVEQFRPVAPLSNPTALRAARGDLKRRLLPALSDPDDTLLVLNANRPDRRKRVDLSLEAFAHLVRAAPDVDARLVLHHGVTTPEVDEALRDAARRLGILDRVIFNPLGTEGPQGVVSDRCLAELMAACEIGLNTSMGEGWGLLAFEHASTGAAQVLGRHSAHTELWEDAAVLVEPARRVVGRSSPLALAELDPAAVGEELVDLCRDEARRHDVAVRCHARARDPRFRWSAAEKAFRSFVDRGAAPA